MSTRLAPPLPAAFARAPNREEFFSTADIQVIEEPEAREQPPAGSPFTSCDANLFFGFFFDGTRNNYRKAEATKGYSNVARLYDCFPGQSVKGVLPDSTEWNYNPQDYDRFFRVYIPEVASPFEDVDDSGSGMDETLGAAIAMGGERNNRIVWALIQAINHINRNFLKQPLAGAAEAESIATKISLS